MQKLVLKGPLVTLVDVATQRVQLLEAELARMAQGRDEVNRAIQRAIAEAAAQRGHELPERWEARPVDGGLEITWDDEAAPPVVYPVE